MESDEAFTRRRQQTLITQLRLAPSSASSALGVWRRGRRRNRLAAIRRAHRRRIVRATAGYIPWASSEYGSHVVMQDRVPLLTQLRVRRVDEL